MALIKILEPKENRVAGFGVIMKFSASCTNQDEYLVSMRVVDELICAGIEFEVIG